MESDLRHKKKTEDRRQTTARTAGSTEQGALREPPFENLRAASKELRKTLGMEDADVVAVFAETRHRKDKF